MIIFIIFILFINFFFFKIQFKPHTYSMHSKCRQALVGRSMEKRTIFLYYLVRTVITNPLQFKMYLLKLKPYN